MLPSPGEIDDAQHAYYCRTNTTVSSFFASPSTIQVGQSATLSWNVQAPSDCADLRVTLNGQYVNRVSSQVVSPGSTATYSLRAVMLESRFLASRTVTVIPGLPLTGFVSETYRPPTTDGWDYHRCVPDPVGQVQRLRVRGEILGFRMGDGHPAPDCGPICRSHWQGIQRLSIGDGLYFVASNSEEHLLGSDSAHFAVVHLGSSVGNSRRLGGNRMSPSHPDWDVVPTFLDRIIHSHTIDTDYWHPGGMQTLGRYLFVALEQGSGRAQVVAYDMNAPAIPSERWRFTLHADGYNGAAAVAAAKLDDGRYLLVVSPTRDDLAFYVSEPNKHIGDYGVFSGAKEAYFHKDDNPEFRTYYQNLDLLTSCTGQLYLLGTTAGDGSGTDRVDLFEVTMRLGDDLQYGTPYTVALTREATQVMYCTAKDGGRQCNFDAAVGAYVDPEGRLLLYATEHDNDGPWPWDEFPQGPSSPPYDQGSVKMMEYRSLDHLDNPETSAVEGCTSLEEAFVELYDTKLDGNAGTGASTVTPTSQNSLLMEGATIPNRDYGHFGDAYAMNDQVRAVRYCMPDSYKFRLFEHADYTGTAQTFLGTGQMQGYQWDSNPEWTSGCFMKATSSQCCTSSWHCPDDPPTSDGGSGGTGGNCNECDPGDIHQN